MIFGTNDDISDESSESDESDNDNEYDDDDDDDDDDYDDDEECVESPLAPSCWRVCRQRCDARRQEARGWNDSGRGA